MDDQFRSLVYRACSAVFETMFFLFPEPIDEIPGAGRRGAFAPNGAHIRASITCHGSSSGSFKFFIPRLLAVHITTNFLGVSEQDINEEQILDTAKETVNMVVGSLLGKIDPTGAIKLQIPEATMLDNFSVTEVLKEKGLFLFNTDFGPLCLVYTQQ